MTSAAPPPPPQAPAPQQQQQQQQQPRAADPYPPSTPAASQIQSTVAPPSRRDLRSWWKGFKLPSKHQETHGYRPQGIFGVPLRQSITYANVAISLVDEDGKSYIYGYVPIVVAKCGVFLKERATEVEGIFRLNGSEKRIKELKTLFDSPDRYGKGLVWDGYTVHDAANVLRRYLNDLPEPVVPLDLYEKFREPLKGARAQATGDAQAPRPAQVFDEASAIARYQQLITELPPLNRQLLLYILDLLAVFAAKSDQNRMTPQNLAAIFQPGMLSHPSHAMAPEEYRLNQDVIIFLIENQDHFLIGMQGTAADQKTVEEVQKGTPVLPSTPNPKSGIVRSASTASAGAESVARDGSIRRNKSTSSRRSLHSNGAPSPGSPALTATPTSGLARSNTVPSKKSPAVQSGRFTSRNDTPVTALTPVAPPTTTVVPPPPVVEEVATPPADSSAPSIQASTAPSGSQLNLSVPGARSQERLLEPTTPEATTPSKERKLPILFQRLSTTESDGRQPNKLKKKRGPGSANPSAHSSTASLPHSATVSPNTEATNPLEVIPSASKAASVERPAAAPAAETPSEPTPRASEVPPSNANADNLRLHNVEAPLKTKKSPSTSLNSSFNEGSDLDLVEETTNATVEITSPDTPNDKEKKKRWRLSRKRDDATPPPQPSITSSPPVFGSNSNADASSASISSSAHKPRHSMTGDSSDRAIANVESATSSETAGNGSRENKDDSKKFGNWIKNKYREHKENVEQRRNKSPPGDQRTVSLGSSFLPSRGKSLDLKRAEEEKTPAQQPQTPQMQPQPQPQPQVRPQESGGQQ
ncbi:GTPase activating protein (GAP) for Rho1p [Madurella fahalii]|uniref:GTPase activating protein (GAP) for Rho1p n=1 Tax=Madurella fahalii TaxID=1157608 RepID=A0ABQ0GSS1_9PEZI